MNRSRLDEAFDPQATPMGPLDLPSDHFNHNKNGHKIIVIGAGFAGLSCAYELASQGYEVVVLEARNRAGGRVISFGDFINGKTVEGGGELIGTNHRHCLKYANKFGLTFLENTDEEGAHSPLILKGKALSRPEKERIVTEMEHVYERLNRVAAQVDADKPWETPGAVALDLTTMSSWISALQAPDLCKAWLSVRLMADNGVHPDRQSLLGNLAMVKGGGLKKYWTETERLRCNGGNQQIAMKLAGGLSGQQIYFNSPVSAISYAPNGVLVETVQGGRYEADDVVMTVPPAVWHKIRFKPMLPPQLKPQMGAIVKYIAGVKGKFWQQAAEKTAPHAASDGALNEIWEATLNQPGEHGEALACYSGGPSAHTCRNWGKSREEAYLHEMEQIYPEIRENFTRGRFMDWHADPFAGGGFCFPAPGEVISQGPLLHDGLGTLHFAGEHCCYRYIGYMEGALDSGVSVATKIMKRDGLWPPP
jgi:monoamine oxidase